MSLEHEARTVVFYESPHRIQKTLVDIAECLKHQPARPIIIARELTKMHEQVITTTIEGLSACAQTIQTRGEFVIVIGPNS